MSPNIITYIDNLADGFDDTMADTDPIDVSELEANFVDIKMLVSLGDVLGHGKYGVVRKGQLLNTRETVAVKIIKKSDLNERDLFCIKVEFHNSILCLA